MTTGTLTTHDPAPSPAGGPSAAHSGWRHVPALDGLRGAAVIGVLLFHDGRLDGGFLGVDLFFALSGFLITGLLLDERARRGGVALGAFWARRARRLLPAMLLFLAVIVPLMYLFGTPSQVEDARDGIVPSLLYVINWYQILQDSDYWALFTDPSPMTHLWSLAVEEQFYIVWPLVVALVFTRRHWKRWMLAIVGGGIVASGVAMALLYDPSDPTRAYIGTDTRAASILLGALAALVGAPRIAQRCGDRSPVMVQGAQLALVGVLAWMWITVDGQQATWLFHGGMILHATCAALLAASVGLSTPTIVQRVFAVRVLRWFGTLSYGLYLWHWPVFILLDERRTGLDGLTLSALRFGVSIAAAVASFRLVEQPMRRHHHRWTTARTRGALAGLAAISLLTVVAVPERDTAPEAFDPTSITLPTTAPTAAPTTLPPPPPGAPTTTTAPLPLVRSLLWQGDSVAFDTALGVDAAATAAGLRADDTTILGFGLVARDDVDPVASYRDRVAEYDPDLVVLMLSSWDSQFPADVQLAAFDEYARMVLDSGASLVVVTPPPVDTTFQSQDVSVMSAAAAELAASDPRVTFLDASVLWGPYARDMNGDGIPERKWDSIHVCPQGAALFGSWLVGELAMMFDGIQPAPPAEWAGGTWTQDPRYSSPPGACIL